MRSAMFVPMLLVAAAMGATGREVVVQRWDFDKPGDAQGWVVGANIADFAVADGRLRFRTTSSDPYIIGPPVQAPLDGCVVRVAMRCRSANDTQVYWRTIDHPGFSEQQVMNRYSPGCGSAATQPEGRECVFEVLEFPIGRPTDAGRVLTSVRVDPCSGPVGEVGEIDYIELVRVPPVLEVTASFDRHRAAVDEAATLAAHVRQIAGWQDRTTYDVSIDAADATPFSPASQPTSVERNIRFDRGGVHQRRVRLHAADDAVTSGYDMQTSIIIGEGETLPLVPVLRTDQVRLDFVRAAGAGKSETVAAARWCVRDRAGEWRLAGWLMPLARVTVQDEHGRIVQREPAFTMGTNAGANTLRHVRLQGAADDLSDWRVQIEFDVATEQGIEVIAMAARLDGPVGGKLLEFAAPMLLMDREPAVDPLQRWAVFGGLEMLEPGWSSSSDRAVGDKFAARWSPSPYKISLPMMTVEAGGLTSSLMWQPTDCWAGPHNMPVATFASPNFIDRQANHLCKLSAPNIPEWRTENQAYARTPYIMQASAPLTLRYVLQAQADLPAMVASQVWYRIFGTPLPPPEAHSDRVFNDLVARCYNTTLYWPKENGWTQYWFMSQKPGFQADIVAFLRGYAAGKPVASRGDGAEQDARPESIIDAAGTLVSRVAGARQARNAVAAMRPDGTWPFHNTQANRKTTLEVTNGKYDRLGEDGATTLGTCAMPAVHILESARLSGDADLIATGLKALAAMRQFRVPRGAQVWEVPLEVPDIRAAALAVHAYHMGYQLTGDTQYLDDAQYWAWAGVPFIYSWRVPAERTPGSFVGSRDREATRRESIPIGDAYACGNPQVTPYGTLPVLGPSFYAINWFGVLVQWCGLEWAEHVIELDADRPDPLLRYIADGVVLSGLQQMMDKEPWIGLYPDSWILEQNIAQSVLLYPALLLRCRQAQGRLPDWSAPWTRVLHDPPTGRRWHVSSWGKPLQLDAPGAAPWSATVEWPAGQPDELVLAGIDRPRAVAIGGVELSEHQGQLSGTQTGWTYDAEHRLLMARFVQPENQSQLRVAW